MRATIKISVKQNEQLQVAKDFDCAFLRVFVVVEPKIKQW